MSAAPALDQMILGTERLLLKELTPEIMDILFSGHKDEEIMVYLGLTTAEELATERANHKGGLTTYRISFRNFLLEERESGKVIGRCGFHTWYTQHARAEIGYAMASDEVKNKGYMTEAVKAIIRYGFEQMDLNRIEAFIGSANVPSLRMVKGLGFTEEGTLRSHYYKNGRMEDSICFSLLRSEYEQAQQQ